MAWRLGALVFGSNVACMTSSMSKAPNHDPMLAVRLCVCLVEMRRISQDDGSVDQAVHTLPSPLDRILRVLVVGRALREANPAISRPRSGMDPAVEGVRQRLSVLHRAIPCAVGQGSCAFILIRTARPTTMDKAHKRRGLSLV